MCTAGRRSLAGFGICFGAKQPPGQHRDVRGYDVLRSGQSHGPAGMGRWTRLAECFVFIYSIEVSAAAKGMISGEARNISVRDGNIVGDMRGFVFLVSVRRPARFFGPLRFAALPAGQERP